MRLNNKGFAITGILYTVFVLFLLILLSVLGGLNIKRQLLERNMESIYSEIEEVCMDSNISLNGSYLTDYQGKYVFDVNGTLYETYLPKGKEIVLSDLSFIGVTGSLNGSATIVEICTMDNSA